MDAAKACATSDKNVRDVFEQHLCWPEGRAPFMGRVNASLAARLVLMNTDGTAKRHNFRQKPGVSGRAAFEPSRVGRVLRGSIKIAPLSRTKQPQQQHRNMTKREIGRGINAFCQRALSLL
ncbi:hypothetical protein RC99_02470 [Pectobacterium carotovorum subsp. carotovorum]|nr:hypothetical protein RC99_02470 [Pectobacterium carotovorum subsp. carotovorum]